jgi:hypothetical protein
MKPGYIKYITAIASSLILAFLIVSCETQEILVSEIEFFIAKDWKIESVVVNGEVQSDKIIQADNPTHSLSFYRLTLNEDFTFTQTGIDGETGSGVWALTSGLTQLVLFVDDPREVNYLLLNLEIRRLEMRALQDDFKNGQLDIRYTLEPVKGK